MQIQLSQKERMFLEDGKSQEELCVEKYKTYSEQAQDQELKQLFNKLSGQEQQHYDTINQLLQGQQPNLAAGGQNNANSQNIGASSQNANASSQNMGTSSQTQQSSTQNNSNQHDKMLCTDLLSTEKYVASTYNMDVFESANPVVRQTMQHIQQEEQKHGEEIFNYMNAHGMYSVK